MSILKKSIRKYSEYSEDLNITVKSLSQILENTKYKKEIFELFEISDEPISIGNLNELISNIIEIDKKCKKIDIISKRKNIQLKEILHGETALFEIFEVRENYINKNLKKDLLIAESCYAAKGDILDYYYLSKFSSYCAENSFEDLLNQIIQYLKEKYKDNEDEVSVRIVHSLEENKFFLRAITSAEHYKDYGINFSVFVSLITLHNLYKSKQNRIYIDYYSIDDSNIYISFMLDNEIKLDDNTSLTINLTLENDEVKRHAVSYNGIFKIRYSEGDKFNEVILKPDYYKREDSTETIDLLTFRHAGKVSAVKEKLTELPHILDYFVQDVKDQSKRVISISNPNDVKLHIIDKIKKAKKAEFQKYKTEIINKLITISVDNIFKLFGVLREVEELFEHDDIVSRDFWRNKLYQVLIAKKEKK